MMPFDPTPVRPEVSPSGVEIGKLRLLSDALKREMPEGFEWDFSEVYVQIGPSIWDRLLGRNKCGTAGCALGLAQHIGILHGLDGLDARALSHGRYSLFGLSKAETARVFADNLFYDADTLSHVIPLQVAAAIDRIILREEKVP